jgi:tRNA(adenine34) deaminase
MKEDEWFMADALQLAHEAWGQGEVPVGALVVNDSGQVLSRAHNLKEKSHNPCGHAEILALQTAGKAKGDWRLDGCRLIVTLEPCSMCMAALVHARIDKLVFGAYDPKAGSLSLGLSFHQHPQLNHRFQVVGGVMHYQCSKLLSQFFKQRRQAYKE